MSNFLNKICEIKKEKIKDSKLRTSTKDYIKIISQSSESRNFMQSLKYASKDSYGLITEIKRSSPSAGIIKKNLNIEYLAKIYESSGAACLSILTEDIYFKGSNQDLVDAKANVNIPCLRKDFIIDEYQVLESKAIGADAILIIMAAIDDKLAYDLEKLALELNMQVLIEVHNEEELERATKLNSKMIGVNNRNLKTLITDIETSKKIYKLVPKDYIIISESGLKNSRDLAKLAEIGIRNFLVGESLLKSNDIAKATKELLAYPYSNNYQT